MGLEIERKFLIDNTKIITLKNGCQIQQGYIKTVDHTTVRVRIKGKEAFLTIKGENHGLTRLEFEYSIPLQDAKEMINNLCQSSLIDKTRYLVEHKGHTWEVDVFEGNNKGLIIAEIELKTEDESFSLPSWVTQEVTHNIKYFNANLIANPYVYW